MAKTSGLGDNLWVSGNDLSGDTQSGKLSGGPALLDLTPINVLAHFRLGGQRTAGIDWVSFWNSTGAHPVLSALPTSDILATYVCNEGSLTAAIGNPAFNVQGKQLNYDPTRSNKGDLTMAVSTPSNGFSGEWGTLLTPGIRTDAAATNGTGFDGAGGFVTPAVPLSTVPVSNTSAMPMTVVISGGTVTTVLVNGVSAGSGDGTYTVPQGGTIAVTYSAAPTWTWTAVTAFGAQAYLHVFAFTGTDATVKVQDSADGVTYTDVAGFAFAQTTSGPGFQRIAIGNTATLRRYVRASTITSGGFSSLQFAVVLVRNLNSGVVF